MSLEINQNPSGKDRALHFNVVANVFRGLFWTSYCI